MSRRCHLIPLTALRLLWLMLVASPMGPAPAQSWTETTWEDFADGQFDAAGQNLYASHDGSLRSIHRFDLNQDGQLDLIFNNTHDTTAFLDATLAHFAADRTLATSPLAVRGSLRGTAADLNQDGHADLVFLPNRSGVQAPRRFLTVIWGGADGWPAHRSNEALPVYEPADMAVADLNADQWPDLVVLSHRPSYTGLSPAREMVVRIFWGGEQGYSLLRYKDVAVPLATALTSGDFDQDDVADVALLTQEGHLLVGWGRDGDNELSISPQPLFESPIAGAQCLESHELDTEGAAALIVGTDRKAIVATRCDSERTWRPWQTLAPLSATGLTIGDLDGDHQPDLVATHLTTTEAMGGERGAAAGAGTVRVLWGSPEGYDAQRMLELPVPFAHAAAIGDVDGDSHADLAVAVYQGESTFAAASQIFFGNGHRALTPSPSGVATSGATDVMIVPVRGRTAANVVFCNSQGGTLDERVPLQIYWGGERGFDPAQMDEIPFTS
ncbi:MAG: FG-GAP and VCBS repeat-containing protein, partial [Phycisphaeraceae bacterium]